MLHISIKHKGGVMETKSEQLIKVINCKWIEFHDGIWTTRMRNGMKILDTSGKPDVLAYKSRGRLDAHSVTDSNHFQFFCEVECWIPQSLVNSARAVAQAKLELQESLPTFEKCRIPKS